MTKPLASVWWFGGKGQQLKRLLPIINGIPHLRYVEPFGGGASVLLNKRPAELEVYNDLDGGLVHFYRTIADPESFEAFRRRVEVLPYARELYDDYRASWRTIDDPTERAAAWYVVARMSFSGRFGSSWGSATTATSRGMSMVVSAWLSAIDRLPEVHARMRTVQVECQDAMLLIPRYDSDDTLFYLDPPYVKATRRSGEYAHEMTNVQQDELVTMLCGVKGKVVLSGYPSPVYDPLVRAGWETIEYDVACHAVGRTAASGLKGAGACDANQRRTECLWINPAAATHVAQLHAMAGGAA